MSTWEERMAQRAKAKGWGSGPATGGRHAGHETHTEGNAIICECGELMGVFSIAVNLDPKDDAPDQTGV